MKKIILSSLVAIFIGGIFAFYMFFDIKKSVASVIREENAVYAFQVGAFSKKENAINCARNYESSYIYENNGKYNVFIAIYQNQKIIDYLSDFYKKNNIDYYLKKIHVNDKFLSTLKKYETMLGKSDDKNLYTKVNKEILAAFNSSL